MDFETPLKNISIQSLMDFEQKLYDLPLNEEDLETRISDFPLVDVAMRLCHWNTHFNKNFDVFLSLCKIQESYKNRFNLEKLLLIVTIIHPDKLRNAMRDQSPKAYDFIFE